MSILLTLTALSQILTTTPAPKITKQEVSIQAPTNTQQLFNQALKSYQTQNYSEAAKLFQQAATAFGSNGDKLNQALSWNYLSLTYQELGLLSEAGVINDSIKLLPNQTGSKQYLSVRAQAFNTLGKLQLTQGQPENALSSWQEAINIYSILQDISGKIGTQINYAQGLQALGLFRQTLNQLENVRSDLEKQQDPVLKATGLLALGNAMRTVGNLKLSKEVLDDASKITQVTSKEMQAEILLSKGNTVQAQKQTLGSEDVTLKEQKTQDALQLYNKAAETSENPTTQVQAKLNILRLLIDSSKPGAQTISQQIESQLNSLPPSHHSTYARINFAQSLVKLAKKTNSAEAINIAAKVVVTGIKQAQSLNDLRGEAYALGTLGNLYEQTQQWDEAENLTNQALKISEGIQAKDISSRWFWQLGRIKSVTNNPERNLQEAISAYEQSVNILVSLRRDLAAVNRDVQFSFREEVEPVYREYVRLLLQTQNGLPDVKTLDKARQAIESLQLAELNNFFRSACLDSQPVQIESIDKKQSTSVIYPVILSDRLAVITWLPNQPKEKSLKLHTVNISQAEVENQVNDMRQKLVIRSTYEFLLPAQEIYNWLIRPIEADLQSSSVKNLVFVLDGTLQSIPMAALHDQQKEEYLIEKGYDIALTPGLELLPPRDLSQGRLDAVVGGISKEVPGFPALPGVEKELSEIRKKLAATKDLLNTNFTRDNIEQAVTSSPAPIVHLATHGKFSSRAEDTYILAWTTPVNVTELDKVLKARETNQQQAIELLVLSACQTATGDDRAALGLAGIAIQSGARSTIASLWSVNDDATTNLMIQFYKQFIKNPKARGEALRLAQMSLLRGEDPTFKHPYYWAPFVLVGNWQ